MWEVGLPTSVCAGIPSTSSPFPILNDNGGGKAGSSAPAQTGGGGGGLYHLPHIQIVPMDYAVHYMSCLKSIYM